MKEEFCFKLSFLQGKEKLPNELDLVYHAHLITTLDTIELQIFYNLDERSAAQLFRFICNSNSYFIGEMMTIEYNENGRLKTLDLSKSKVLRISKSSASNPKHISIELDSAIFFREPEQEPELMNTAEFYLNDAGFILVNDYYSLLFPQNEEGNLFSINRMNGASDFYTLGDSTFRPEFHFVSSDRREARVAQITKKPTIQFRYNENLTLEEALKYAEIVRLIASFYYHVEMDYLLSYIRLKDYTVTIKKVYPKIPAESRLNLRFAGYNFDFNGLMKSNWQTFALSDWKRISKVIELFLQARLVDNNSRFLISYNIIEICMNNKEMNSLGEKFDITVNRKMKNQKYNEALDILLTIIHPHDAENFRNRWNDISSKILEKPMNTLLAFLETQGLTPNNLPISPSSLRKMRNSITHGSLDTIKDSRDIERANILLYRITAILILNLLGLKDWELDTDIDN